MPLGNAVFLPSAAVPAHIPPWHTHLRDLVDSSDTDCIPDKASIPLPCLKHILECLSSLASHVLLSYGKHFLKLTQKEEHSRGWPWRCTAQISLPENLQPRGNMADSLQLLRVQICCGVHTRSMVCLGHPLQCKGRASLVAHW